MARPDPFAELRLVALRSLRGANFWSSFPVTRIDVAVGAFDHVSSADVPGLADALAVALPGLVEHRCSIGERGGFLTRLRRGTYAPHILEHLALELQAMIGHEVGFGRARGGDRPGEYTVVFEHRHAEVGLRAAAHALELVQRAFAGEPLPVEHALAELQTLAMQPDVPPLQQHVRCGVTGGGPRAALRDALAAVLPASEPVVEVAPAYILNAGLPYARSDLAVILDAEPTDVPERYREPDRAQRLVSVVADAVPRDGIVIVPATEWEVQDLVRDAGCRVAVFHADGEVTPADAHVAHAAAFVRGGRMLIECGGVLHEAGALDDERPPAVQLAVALARYTWSEAESAARAAEQEASHG